uniref:Transposase (putative) gypsy type domain-containing protein n=1 Tax=Fagus sylvatica TaxID=28930 RepID=A0A2N9EDI3_FAGSY
MFEVTFRQIFAFNEEASLQAAGATCRHATGRSFVLFTKRKSSLAERLSFPSLRFSGEFPPFPSPSFFFRFAENGLGPPPIEGFVFPDSVLHRLSAELYSELPEGLSDESAGGVTREVSSEAVPSTSGSRQLPRIDRSWKAMSYFSKIRQDDIDRIRRRYQVPDDVVLRIPDPNERACCPKYEGDVAFYEADLRAGLRFPVQPFVRELLDFLSLAPGQVNPNGWRTIISCMVMWRVNSNGEEDLTVDEFLFCYEPVQIALSRGFWTFKNRDVNSRVVQGLPSSNRIWKDGYFFVCGDNWERLPQEDPRDFVGVRRAWGTPSSFGSSASKLSVWQERILRILDIEDRRYDIFIEPDLLATFSLGPVPSSSVKALVRANKKRIDTMKLNKSRLKQLAQSGEVAAAPVSLKRKKPKEGSSKRAEEAPSRPSVPTVTPPVVPTAVPSVQKAPTVVMVDSDLTPPSDPSASTINQSPHVAMDRAKGAISSRDMDEYAVAHTEDLSYLMVHSLMRSMADKVEMKNAKRAIMELTRDRKEALAEAENLKKELKAREDDVKAAVDAKDKAVADFKHLVGQIEGAKEAAVSDFRASEAFEDINTRLDTSYPASRLSGSKAVQRFPGLDFLRSSSHTTMRIRGGRFSRPGW